MWSRKIVWNFGFCIYFFYFVGLWLNLIINSPNWLPEVMQLNPLLVFEILSKLFVFKNFVFFFNKYFGRIIAQSM